jgi:hypothetical protein
MSKMAEWKKYKSYPDVCYLHTALIYDPDTGHFWWRHRPDMPKCWNARWPGKRAGNHKVSRAGANPRFNKLLDRSYIYISLQYSLFQAGRLAFAMSHGRYPYPLLDYKNGNGMDNRLCNLGEATHRQNTTKRGKMNGGPLPVGVCARPATGKFEVNMRVAGVSRFLGSYDTPEAAGKVYAAATLKHNGVFASRQST